MNIIERVCTAKNEYMKKYGKKPTNIYAGANEINEMLICLKEFWNPDSPAYVRPANQIDVPKKIERVAGMELIRVLEDNYLEVA